MDPLSQEMHDHFRRKFEVIYLDFIRMSITIAAATIAAIVISSGRFDQNEIPFLLRLSMLGFLLSILFGAALQFCICIDISGFLERIEVRGIGADDMNTAGNIYIKNSRKFIASAILHVLLFFTSLVLLVVELILQFII